MLAYIVVPSTQIIFSSHLDYRVILGFFILASLAAVYLAFYFHSNVFYVKFQEKEKSEGVNIRASNDVIMVENEKNT